MVVVVIMAIVSLAVLSTSNAAATEEGRLASEMFASDVEYARSLAIARPDDPVIMKVDAAANKYWLARASAPDVPITHPFTKKPYVVSFGANGTTGLKRVQITAYDFSGDSVLGFNALGTTDQATDAVMQVASAGQAYEITVQPVGVKTTVHKGLTKALAVPAGLEAEAIPMMAP
jgi:hypothetical protein